MIPVLLLFFFFFIDTATTEIYTLSLHDALPISIQRPRSMSTCCSRRNRSASALRVNVSHRDRKSTRLNSSHLGISYAVFCLKKKKKKKQQAKEKPKTQVNKTQSNKK